MVLEYRNISCKIKYFCLVLILLHICYPWAIWFLFSTLQAVEEDKENMAKQYEDELTDLRDKTRTMEDTKYVLHKIISSSVL